MKLVTFPSALFALLLANNGLAAPIEEPQPHEEVASSSHPHKHKHYTYPSTTKMYHLKTGYVSSASAATLAGTVTGNTLMSSSTTSTWSNFYLSGTDLVWASPTGPMYAQIAGESNPPKYQADVQNVVFSNSKSGYEISCTMAAATGQLSCSVPSSGSVLTYTHFGLPSGSAPGHVVMYGQKMGPINIASIAALLLAKNGLAAPVEPIPRAEAADNKVPHLDALYAYPPNLKMFHLRVGTVSTAAKATLGTTASSGSLMTTSTSSNWSQFYLEGNSLVWASPSGPQYAQLAGEHARVPYDTESIVFNAYKIGPQLLCQLTAATGALSCSAPSSVAMYSYGRIGLPLGGAVVVYGEKLGQTNLPPAANMFFTS
ncbi:hypothetical protein ANO11243_071600 [Dothideomycetidae sp. 11243]|nr:hypothetical protein ANO11243_071600 [fungal sp. No.11243]